MCVVFQLLSQCLEMCSNTIFLYVPSNSDWFELFVQFNDISNASLGVQIFRKIGTFGVIDAKYPPAQNMTGQFICCSNSSRTLQIMVTLLRQFLKSGSFPHTLTIETSDSMLQEILVQTFSMGHENNDNDDICYVRKLQLRSYWLRSNERKLFFP